MEIPGNENPREWNFQNLEKWNSQKVECPEMEIQEMGIPENGNPKTDPLNPDERLRTRSRLGMVVMNNFAYIEGNVWDNGQLYNPGPCVLWENDRVIFLTL